MAAYNQDGDGCSSAGSPSDVTMLHSPGSWPANIVTTDTLALSVERAGTGRLALLRQQQAIADRQEQGEQRVMIAHRVQRLADREGLGVLD